MSTMSRLRQLNESLVQIEMQGNVMFESCKLFGLNAFVCTDDKIETGNVSLRDYLQTIEAFLMLIKNAGFCIDKTEIHLTNESFRLSVYFSWENED